MRALHGALIAAATLLAPLAASAQDDIWSHQINDVGYWSVLPDRPRVRELRVPEEQVPGERAQRVQGRAGANPWVVQARSPISGGINQGDVVMVMYYARAEQAPEGGAVLPTLLQLEGAPYTTGLSANKSITDQWEQHCFHGVATADLPGGRSQVAIHLGTAEQVIDLGPVFVFNFGPNYDRANLPNCD